jgi:hypothetical protein
MVPLFISIAVLIMLPGSAFESCGIDEGQPSIKDPRGDRD